tara:strand:- start:33 stop:761 length:729 start_codon:yes stop_codon:yes gene_type:complete
MIGLKLGDCLELMKSIPDGSIDAIITDPPYGTTACKWDSVIDFDLMWEQLNRIIKPNGAIVLFGSEPFSSALRMSNIKNYKYDWVWEKSRVSHFAQAPYRPLTVTENIITFSFGGVSKNAKIRMVYNPQGLVDCNKTCKGKGHSDHRPSNVIQKNYKQTKTGYPKQILKFNSDRATNHPTQKPVALMEYLINTYTKENETVLDFTMGSGSTGVAAKNLNRKFIGIEQDENYFNIATERIKNT